MKWFVVSLISVIDASDPAQSEFPVFEDFFLFSSSSEEELQAKIEKEKSLINASGDCQFFGKTAKKRCLGARKIRSIYNDEMGSPDASPPSNGTELTHSFMTVSSIADAELLAMGKTVLVTYVDDDE